MSTLMKASRQWAMRPSDQRFTSLLDMERYCSRMRDLSTGRVVSSRRIEAAPVEGDSGGLRVLGPEGAGAFATHWSFGQLAQRAGAGTGVGLLRDLPGALAADCINYLLRFKRDVEEIGVLLTGEQEDIQLRAVTGPNYGRVWDADIVKALVGRFGDGVTGDFKVPGEFGHAVDVTKANTTLFASDRDMFVFLADEKNRIEIPNRRNGEKGTLARGFFVWNSEVGKTSYGIAMFLFDYVCCNRIVWGAQDYQEIRGLHTAGAPDRWLERVAPAIEAYANASATPVIAAIEAAQAKKVDDIEKFLANRNFNKTEIVNIKAAHLADEGRPMETLWDVTTGVTAYARNLPYQDARVGIERRAGEIMDLAA